MDNRNVRQEGEIGLHLQQHVLPHARIQPDATDGKQGDCTRFSITTTSQIWIRKQQIDEWVPEDELLPYLSTDQLWHLTEAARANEILPLLEVHPITTDEVYKRINAEFLEGQRNNRDIPEDAPRILVEHIESYYPWGHSSDSSEESDADQPELSDYFHENLSEILQNRGCFVGTLQYYEEEMELTSSTIYRRGQDFSYEDKKTLYHSVCVVGEGGTGPDAYYVYLNSYGAGFGDNGLGRINKRFIVEAFYIKPVVL